MKEFNPDAFFNPEKYKKKISIDKIVADPKVYRKGVERYKEMLIQGKDLGTIVVIKHPRKDFFAVLDGHHRFHALLESDVKEANCAVIGEFSISMFDMTKNGWFQPSPEVTEYVRVPILKLKQNLEEYLKNFLKNPEKLKKMQEKSRLKL